MNDEEQKEVEETTEEVQETTETTETTDTEETVTEPSEPAEEQEIDHAAELEEIKKKQKLSKKQNKENALVRLKKQGKVEDGDDDVETPVRSTIDPDAIQAIVDQAVQQATESTRKEVGKHTVNSIIISGARTAAEAEHALWIYENRLNSTGDPQEDAEDALVLANKKRYKQENSELRRAFAARENTGNASGSGQKTKTKDGLNLSDKEKKLMKVMGITESDIGKDFRQQ